MKHIVLPLSSLTFCLSFLGIVFSSCTKNDPMDHMDNPSTFDHPQDRFAHELSAAGYDYALAGDGAPYVPGQYIVQFRGLDQDAMDKKRDSIQTLLGPIRKIKDCGCLGQIEIWEVDSLKSKENGKQGKNKLAQALGHEESQIAENLYVLPDKVRKLGNADLPSDALPAGFSVPLPPGDDKTVIIALLDTGIDWSYKEDMQDGKYIMPLWFNPYETDLDGQDSPSDPMCFVDDMIGWDFVNNDNAPFDDHSHGTFLAGIMATQATRNLPQLDYRIMPLKILDKNGVGQLGNAMCAIIYASLNGADMINMSWGYYGQNRKLLEQYMRTASQVYKINHLASAGNDGLNLVNSGHYPSALSENLDAIGLASSLDEANERLDSKSNYRQLIYAASGQNVQSILPKHLIGLISDMKSGTSISTAFGTISSAAVRYDYELPPGRMEFWPVEIVEKTREIVTTMYPMDTIVINGERVIYFPIKEFKYP